MLGEDAVALLTREAEVDEFNAALEMCVHRGGADAARTTAAANASAAPTADALAPAAAPAAPDLDPAVGNPRRHPSSRQPLSSSREPLLSQDPSRQEPSPSLQPSPPPSPSPSPSQSPLPSPSPTSRGRGRGRALQVEMLEAAAELLATQGRAQAEAHNLESVRRVMLCGLRLADQYPLTWGPLYRRALAEVQAAVGREYEGAQLVLRR